MTVKRNNKNLDALFREAKSGRVDLIVLDLSQFPWLNPQELVRFKCLMELARRAQITVQIKSPLDQNVARYIKRMGLVDFAAGATEMDSGRSFFPLYAVTGDDNSALFDELKRVFDPEGPSVNWPVEVASALTELVDNIFYHAGERPNTGWGYAQAQKLANARKICVGIADVGVGYAASYRRTGQDRGRSTRQIVEDSFKLQESSLNFPGKPPHRGIGLSLVKDFVNGFNGTMKLFTDNVCARIIDGKLSVVDLDYDVCGSWIYLEIPIV